MRLANFQQSSCEPGDRPAPADRLERALCAQQRCRQPLGIALPGMRVAALRAQMSPVHGGVGDATNPEPLRVTRLDLHAATDAAIATDGIGDRDRTRRFRGGRGLYLLLSVAIEDRAGRAVVHAGTARRAVALREAFARTEDQAGFAAAAGDRVDELPLDLCAGAYAEPAGDAARAIEAQV